MAKAGTHPEKTFTKKVGDKTLTRTVTTAEGEVTALFDGYTEAPASSTTAAKAAPSKPSN